MFRQNNSVFPVMHLMVSPCNQDFFLFFSFFLRSSVLLLSSRLFLLNFVQ